MDGPQSQCGFFGDEFLSSYWESNHDSPFVQFITQSLHYTNYVFSLQVPQHILITGNDGSKSEEDKSHRDSK
jgi:hypothetical protein